MFFIIDLFFFGRHAYNLIHRDFFSSYNKPEWIQKQNPARPFRIMMNPFTLKKYKNYIPKNYYDCFAYRNTLIPNLAISAGLFDAGGYAILKVNDYDILLNRLTAQGYTSKVLNLLNVKYLISDRVIKNENWKTSAAASYDIKCYENLKALPRAIFLTKLKVLRTRGEVLDYMFSPAFNPEKEVVFSEQDIPPDLSSSIKQNPSGEARIKITGYMSDKIELQVKADSAGWLFLSETYYPGWKVYINDGEDSIYRSDYIFRSVYIKKGINNIKLVYAPLSFKRGLALSIAGLILLLLYFLSDLTNLYNLRKY